jgi:hypothetical protein
MFTSERAKELLLIRPYQTDASSPRSKQDLRDLIELAYEDLCKTLEGTVTIMTPGGTYPVHADLLSWGRANKEKGVCHACLAGIVFLNAHNRLFSWTSVNIPYYSVIRFLDSLRSELGWEFLEEDMGFRTPLFPHGRGSDDRIVCPKVMKETLEEFLKLNPRP